VHDFKLLKEEFPPEQNWFKHFKVRVDLGYLGIAQEYVCKTLSLPHKKRKQQELSAVQKWENRGFAQERVPVEHAIGGLKRYRILSERLRLHDFGLYNDVLGVCAGLWNFQLSH
jgi:DDE superfamily endonuclease